MVTIDDIAKLAKVSHGTVSNVLNNKGNVSSDKIKRVLDAAKQLSYTPNESAANLRKKEDNLLSLIMPEYSAKQYRDFYLGFSSYAESHNYRVKKYTTYENFPESELTALKEALMLSSKGTACLSIAAGTSREKYVYSNISIPENFIFVEHRPTFSHYFVGFNYEEIALAMSKIAIRKNYSNICLLTGNTSYSNEKAFYECFINKLKDQNITINHISTDDYRKFQNIMHVFNGPVPQAFFISNYAFAKSAKDICETFYPYDNTIEIYTASPIFTMPENNFQKYEMDYRHLGKVTAESLIKDKKQNLNISGIGFRNWYKNIPIKSEVDSLNVICIDSPEAYLMKHFAKLFTKKSGIKINIGIYSYDEIYEIFNNMNKQSDFDIIRLDVTWLSWFAEKLLMPLKEIDSNIDLKKMNLIDNIEKKYSYVNGTLYALPYTPSTQILYYRRDLFENPIYQRLYFEKYKKPLEAPKSFSEYNQISSFFTKSINPESPVNYGTTITMGSSGVAGSEYLARFFSHQKNLYNSDMKIELDSNIALQSLNELIAIKKYTSHNYCKWWTDTANAFASGDYAMSILYSNYASQLMGHKSNIVGNVSYSLVPGNNPVIGGGSLGVFKHSKHPREALDFILWMCSETISSATTYLGSTSPCKNAYKNYSILHNFPWMKLAPKSFSLASGKRTPSNYTMPFDERKFLGIIGMAVKNTYSGISSPEKALKDAQESFSSKFETNFK